MSYMCSNPLNMNFVVYCSLIKCFVTKYNGLTSESTSCLKILARLGTVCPYDYGLATVVLQCGSDFSRVSSTLYMVHVNIIINVLLL